MTEPNPYEAPQAAEPLSVGAAAKRAGGIGLILLLTPLAVMIAFGGSCTMLTLAPMVTNPNLGAAIELSIIFGIPFGVLIAMTHWAAWRHYCNTTPNKRHGRIITLLVTPWIVAAAVVLGYAATFALINWGQAANITAPIATFVSPPLLALVAMLCLAWRCDRARM